MHSADSSVHLQMFHPYTFHPCEFVFLRCYYERGGGIKVYGRFSHLFVSAGERSAEGKEEL